MKNSWWKYGIVIVGLVLVFIVGYRLDVFAAGKKAEKNGADIAARALRESKEVESIKITMDVYAAESGEAAKRGKMGGSIEGLADAEDDGGMGNAGADGTGGEISGYEDGEIDEDMNASAKAESREAEKKETEDGEIGDKEREGKGTEEEETEDEGAEGQDAEEENAEEIDAYFDDSVFVGDSIMLGFRNYAMKRQDTFLSRMNFLAAGSFSANNALWEVNEKSVHPVYQGEQRQVWESISLMGSKKVFLMLGMNDLNVTGLEGSCEKYEELIGKIKESSPDAEIYIMSMTYVLKGKETGKLENGTIREFNSMLKEMAEKNGWGFVDVAEALADGNGDLAEEYCSDGFAHQNPDAYDVWVSVLRKYAAKDLGMPCMIMGNKEAKK